MIEIIKYGSISWSHIDKPTNDDFEFLEENYHFHPLDIIDCKSTKTLRPKIDVYDDYYFMNFHFPIFDKFNVFLEIKELKVFLGRDFLITIGKNPWLVKDIFDKEKHDKKIEAGSSDFILYSILNELTKHSQSVVEQIEMDVNECGSLIFNKKAEKTIRKIGVTRKNLISLHTMFKPQLILYNKLQSGTIESFSDSMEDYWGSIFERYQKIWDIIEDSDELIKGYSTTFDSLQVNKTNEVMKILTLISSILLPITFIASLYGMNINLPFQSSPLSFLIVSIMMIIIATFMVGYFRFKEWM